MTADATVSITVCPVDSFNTRVRSFGGRFRNASLRTSIIESRLMVVLDIEAVQLGNNETVAQSNSAIVHNIQTENQSTAGMANIITCTMYIHNYINDSYIDPIESVNDCVALFLRQGLNMTYLQCECHDIW